MIAGLAVDGKGGTGVDESERDEIVRLTEEYGGAWGIEHTRRLLHLVSIIGQGQSYDAEVVWLAAHLHDWGGYEKWAQPGVDHAVRSTQVAEEFMAGRGYAPELVQAVLECIATHHTGDPNRRIEAILLSDADGLDFLGAVGVLRDFAKNPREMRKAFEAAQARRAKVPKQLCLEKSKEMGKERVRRMEELLRAFQEESGGHF